MKKEEGGVTVCMNGDGCLVSDANAFIRWNDIEIVISSVSVVEMERSRRWNSLIVQAGTGV